jgi:hypothetical protein
VRLDGRHWLLLSPLALSGARDGTCARGGARTRGVCARARATAATRRRLLARERCWPERASAADAGPDDGAAILAGVCPQRSLHERGAPAASKKRAPITAACFLASGRSA